MPPRITSPRIAPQASSRAEREQAQALQLLQRQLAAARAARQQWAGVVVPAGGNITFAHRLGATPWLVLRPTGSDVVSAADASNIVLASTVGATVDVLAWVE